MLHSALMKFLECFYANISVIRDKMSNRINRKNKNLAILEAPLEIPVNPKSPAISATIKKMIVHVSMYDLVLVRKF